jgi:diguanylate cyclase (GGDEF)-like protein
MLDRALRSGRTVLAPDYADPAVRGSDPVRSALHALGARSLLVAPLRIRGSVLGVLIAVMTDRSDRRFDGEDTDLMQDVADRAAQAVDNARSYRAARAAEERFRAAFEDAPIGVALLHVDHEGATRYAEVNPALCQIFGADREQLLGEPADELEVGEQRLVREDGEERWVQVQSARLTGGQAGSDPVAYVAQVQDVTERRRFERELEHLASHDPLTGVLNRRRFEEELERTLADVRRLRQPAALVTLDLDNFKHVNDTYGHPAGDDLLRAVARALRDRVRATDAVGRLGGDEFGIVLAHTGEAEAQRVAEGLLEAFRTRVAVQSGERRVRITASAGVRQLSPDGQESATELLGEADMALYEAKERGRDRLAVAGEATAEPRALQHGRWRERIRDALETDGFVLHEQPILRLADDHIDRAELLIRMIGARGEPIPPAAFLPVAERYDDIRDIDRWVVSNAVRLLAARQAGGSKVGASINLSGPSIGDARVIDFILGEIANAGVDPSALMFEVTETTAIGNLDRARVLAQQLSELGCDFALDDFGAGFGSFAYLKHLPLDVIKIDGEFIRTLTRSTQDQVTVRAIVDIAKGLGKETVAEFVEDRPTLELLRRLGVDRAQGYHIGRPRPARPLPDF